MTTKTLVGTPDPEPEPRPRPMKWQGFPPEAEPVVEPVRAQVGDNIRATSIPNKYGTKTVHEGVVVDDDRPDDGSRILALGTENNWFWIAEDGFIIEILQPGINFGSLWTGADYLPPYDKRFVWMWNGEEFVAVRDEAARMPREQLPNLVPYRLTEQEALQYDRWVNSIPTESQED